MNFKFGPRKFTSLKSCFFPVMYIVLFFGITLNCFDENLGSPLTIAVNLEIPKFLRSRGWLFQFVV